MKNIFLTGDVGVGKSTLLEKALESVDCKLGGFYTDRFDINEDTVFVMKSYKDPDLAMPFAKIIRPDIKRIVNEDIFRYNLVRLLKEDIKDSHMIILDELGFMEEDIQEFKSQVFSLLDCPIPVFGVLKKHDSPFLNTIRNRKDVEVIEVNLDNRDELVDYLVKRLGELL